jgi:hypothetical protein
MCKKCKIGTYLTATGADEKEDCKKCPKGNYCSEFGLDEPKDCPKGT